MEECWLDTNLEMGCVNACRSCYYTRSQIAHSLSSLRRIAEDRKPHAAGPTPFGCPSSDEFNVTSPINFHQLSDQINHSRLPVVLQTSTPVFSSGGAPSTNESPHSSSPSHGGPPLPIKISY
ncbi:hypothetical protein Salat_1524100 [Sesamum alatum]|uniref:Uncharacterized protein n=1 Tax=Sesamum alatum TaxID=300844 RepID=A0AAE1YCD5_9LAMI|nr:hypothetical protein Salat_1524100 [Sesamum alatum]